MKLRLNLCDERCTEYFSHQISVEIQHGNAAAVFGMAGCLKSINDVFWLL